MLWGSGGQDLMQACVREYHAGTRDLGEVRTLSSWEREASLPGAGDLQLSCCLLYVVAVGRQFAGQAPTFIMVPDADAGFSLHKESSTFQGTDPLLAGQAHVYLRKWGARNSQSQVWRELAAVLVWASLEPLIYVSLKKTTNMF